VLFFELSNNILERCTAEEELLLESELFSSFLVVIWIKHTGDVFGTLSISDGSMVVSRVERVEVELLGWSGSPKSQNISVVSVESWYWSIVSLSDNSLGILQVASLGSVVVVVFAPSIEINLKLDVGSLDFPWISVFEPVVWNLDLITTMDLLLENTIIIPDTISNSWDLQSGQTV
jgi:hypothetical protein